MKKATKVLHDFILKLAEDDGDISGSTSALTDICHYKEPSDDVKHGLRPIIPVIKKATKNAPKDSPECGAVCRMRWSGMTEEEAMSHWRNEHKSSLKKSKALLEQVLRISY